MPGVQPGQGSDVVLLPFLKCFIFFGVTGTSCGGHALGRPAPRSSGASAPAKAGAPAPHSSHFLEGPPAPLPGLRPTLLQEEGGSLVFTLVRRTGLHYLSLAGASLERPEGDGGGQVSCSLAYGAFWSSASRMPQLKVFL